MNHIEKKAYVKGYANKEEVTDHEYPTAQVVATSFFCIVIIESNNLHFKGTETKSPLYDTVQLHRLKKKGRLN